MFSLTRVRCEASSDVDIVRNVTVRDWYSAGIALVSVGGPTGVTYQPRLLTGQRPQCSPQTLLFAMVWWKLIAENSTITSKLQEECKLHNKLMICIHHCHTLPTQLGRIRDWWRRKVIVRFKSGNPFYNMQMPKPLRQWSPVWCLAQDKWKCSCEQYLSCCRKNTWPLQKIIYPIPLLTHNSVWCNWWYASIIVIVYLIVWL